MLRIIEKGLLLVLLSFAVDDASFLESVDDSFRQMAADGERVHSGTVSG